MQSPVFSLCLYMLCPHEFRRLSDPFTSGFFVTKPSDASRTNPVKTPEKTKPLGGLLFAFR